MIYTGAFLAATLAFGQTVQAESLILGGVQTISTDTVVESVVIGNTGAGPTGGDGSLTINNGATLTSNGTDFLELGKIGGVDYLHGQGYIGLNAGSIGVATVTGANSLWQNQSGLSIGYGGQGTLSIADGGKVISSWGYLGEEAGSTGTVTVTGAGSSWDSGSLYVGYKGNGKLTIEDGGKVTATGDADGNPIGGFPGTTGTVTVTGTGSLLNLNGGLSIRNAGSALNIENGGMVVVSDDSSGAGTPISISDNATATVTGAGSRWENSGYSFLYVDNNGALNIENGGKVTSYTSSIDGAYNNDYSVATVTVTGQDSRWENMSGLDIGRYGNGALNVENGGVVTSRGGVMGFYSSSSSGTATITGTGSRWESSSNITVGFNGQGILNIEDGGKVTNTSGYIGSKSGSAGAVTVTGPGSRLEVAVIGPSTQLENSGQLYIGGDASGAGGNGRLIINDGGVVSATNGVTIWSTGSLSGNGGTIEGDVINHGLISPGNSPGVLTITGDLTLESDSVLLMEIFGPTAYDQLIIGGNFVAGGILELDFGGYMPEFDVPYDLFQVAGGMSGDFSEIKFLNPAAGFDAGLLSLSFAGGENGGMFQLIMANNGDPGNNTVPEPASGLLIGLGGLAMLMLRRRSPRISLA